MRNLKIWLRRASTSRLSLLIVRAVACQGERRDRESLSRFSSSLIIVVLTLSFCLQSALAQRLETWQASIRNGSPAPQTVALTEGQQRAVGWFYVGVPREQFCTGTLVSPTHILTARHCFETPEESSQPDFQTPDFTLGIGFAIGDRKDQEPQATIPIPFTNIYKHGNLDLALITLTEPVSENLATPIPINRTLLEGKLLVPLLGKQVDVSGFGRTGTLNRARGYAAVRVVLISQDSIFVDGNEQQGICGGDSGGPLLAPGADGEVKVFAVEFRGEQCCLGTDQLTRVDIALPFFERAGLDPSPGLELSAEECLGIGLNGSCQDGLLYLCERNRLERYRCEGESVCGYDGERFACIVPEPSCINFPPGGRCEISPAGDKVIRCFHGRRFEESCGSDEGCGDFNGRRGCLKINSPIEDSFPLCDAGDLLDRVIKSQGSFNAVGACHQGLFPPKSSAPLALILFSLLTLSWRGRRDRRRLGRR